MLIAAGIVNSSKDCNIPTKEKATPVKTTVGNNMRKNSAQVFAVSGKKPSAKSHVIGCAKTIPKTVIIQVITPTAVTNILDKRNASSFPFFSRYSLNMGIKLAEIAEAKQRQKMFWGFCLPS